MTSVTICTFQLNRSDSDSAVKYRRGPFQRSAIERRSLRFKKVGLHGTQKPWLPLVREKSGKFKVREFCAGSGKF